MFIGTLQLKLSPKHILELWTYYCGIPVYKKYDKPAQVRLCRNFTILIIEISTYVIYQ
jgi:hypothetical protein